MEDDEFGDNIDWAAVELPSISASMMVANPRRAEGGGSGNDGAGGSGSKNNGSSVGTQGGYNYGGNNGSNYAGSDGRSGATVTAIKDGNYSSYNRPAPSSAGEGVQNGYGSFRSSGGSGIVSGSSNTPINVDNSNASKNYNNYGGGRQNHEHSSGNYGGGGSMQAHISPSNFSSGNEEALRRQIQELQSQLQSKEVQIFELEATAATTAAESNHRAKTAEAEAQKRVHQVEEELRRVKMEVDHYKGSWLRQKKRVVELESRGGGTAAGGAGDCIARDTRNNSNIRLENRGDAKMSNVFNKFSEGRMDGSDGALQFQSPEDNVHSNNDKASSSGTKRRRSHEPDIQEIGTANETPKPLHPHQQVIHLNKNRSKTESTRQRLAQHLLAREEMGSYSLEEDFSDISIISKLNDGSGESGSLDVDENNIAGNDKRRTRRSHKSIQLPPRSSENETGPNNSHKSQSILQHFHLRREFEKDKETRSFVSSLLHQMAIDPSGHNGSELSLPPPLSVSGLVLTLMTRFNSLFQNVDLGVSNNQQPSSCGYKGMIVVVNKESLPRESSNSSDVSTLAPISLRAILYLLKVMKDILVLSGKSRSDLRLWLYRSRHYISGSGGKSADGSPREVLDVGEHDEVHPHPRIEGLPKKYSKHRGRGVYREALWTGTCQPNRDEESSTEWDPVTIPMPCNAFFELLIGLMKGNVFGHLEVMEIEPTFLVVQKTIIQMVQIKAIELVLTLMSDAASYEHTQISKGNPTPYLWNFWFDSLLPSCSRGVALEPDAFDGTSNGGNNTADELPQISKLDDFFSLWEKIEKSGDDAVFLHYNELQLFAPASSATPTKGRIRGNPNVGPASPTLQRDSIAMQYWKDCQQLQSVEILRSILKLLSLLISSSSSIRNNIYQLTSSETTSKMQRKSLARRVLASIYTKVNEFVLPVISSIPNNRVETQKLQQCLRLGYTCVQFFLVLVQSDEGIHMLRLQMRLELEPHQNDNSCWTSSAISIIISLLDSILARGMVTDSTEAKGKLDSDIRVLLNRIVEKCISFFKCILLFVHHQQRYQQTLKFGTTTFLSLISEQRLIFRSCCHKILSTDYVSNDLIMSSPESSILQFNDDLKYDTRMLLEEVLMDENEENGFR